jgi:hypothetical protein
MSDAMWVIEWNQAKGHFHIQSTARAASRNPEYVEVGRIWGAFTQAFDWATEWLNENPKAKAVYRSPFDGYVITED